MAERALWRPRWYLWAAFGLAALVLIQRHMPWLLHGQWLFLIAIMLLATLLLAAVMWELPPARMVCGAILLTIFSGSWGILGLPGFPFLPDRILLVGALLALLLGAPGARGLDRPRVKGVHVLLAVTVLYATASAAAAGTLGTKAGVFDLLDRLGAIPFLMLLLAPVIFSGPRERDMLMVTLVGLGGYLGVTAVFETVGPHSLVFPHYIVTADALKPFSQAGGPFRVPTSNGFACFACGTAAAIAFRKWRRERRRYLAAAVMVLSALGVFLSLERGVWIAAAAAVLAVGLLAPELRRRLVPAVVAGGLLIGTALVVLPALAGNASARAGDQTSVWDRQNQTATALRMIAAKPLFGFGWDNYVRANGDYFRQASGYPMTGFSTPNNPLPLHDSYLSNAVELGLVGALLWLASLFWGIGGAILGCRSPELRAWRLGLVAIAVFFLVVAFFDPLQHNFTELLLWTWAGMLMATTPVAPLRSRAPAPVRSPIAEHGLPDREGSLEGILAAEEPVARRARHRMLEAGVTGSRPYYRRRLHNRRFSIISNDCWGAAVYQHLELGYRTPFVGLFLTAPCFLRLLADLHGYLSSPLEFIEQSGYAYLERGRRERVTPYPIGLLGGDVELHFVHYPTAEAALEKWQRRVERVDYDNLFVKLSADKDLCTYDHLKAFDATSYAHKLCLTAHSYPGIDSAIRIPGYVSNGSTMYRVCLPHVNVIRWLNGGPARRRAQWTPAGNRLLTRAFAAR